MPSSVIWMYARADPNQPIQRSDQAQEIQHNQSLTNPGRSVLVASVGEPRQTLSTLESRENACIPMFNPSTMLAPGVWLADLACTTLTPTSLRSAGGRPLQKELLTSAKERILDLPVFRPQLTPQQA